MTDEVLLRPAMLAEGWRDSELQRERRSGRLAVLRRGAYLSCAMADLEPERWHRLLITAETARLSPESVVRHVSAAIVHGLPVWGIQLARVHVTRARWGGGRAGAKVYVHAAPMTADEVTVADGVAVTAAART